MIELLSKDPDVLRGFEMGIVYMLMRQRCPKILGTYYSQSDESLFLMAAQYGYLVEWKHIDPEKVAMAFTLMEMEEPNVG